MTEKSKERIDADRAFLRLQTQEKAGDRALTESELAAQARAANTARLRELRLQKETREREAAATVRSRASSRKHLGNI